MIRLMNIRTNDVAKVAAVVSEYDVDMKCTWVGDKEDKKVYLVTVIYNDDIMSEEAVANMLDIEVGLESIYS